MSKTNKKWYKSKTVWFNTLSAVILAVNELTGKLIPNEIGLTVVTLGNLILRLVTNTSISK